MTFTSCVDDLDQRPVFEQDATVVYDNPDTYKQVLAKAYACFVITGQEKDGDKDIDSEKGYDLSRCIFNMQEDATDESINTWSSLYDVSHFNWDANAYGCRTHTTAFTTPSLCATSSYATLRNRQSAVSQPPSRMKSGL